MSLYDWLRANVITRWYKCQTCAVYWRGERDVCWVCQTSDHARVWAYPQTSNPMIVTHEAKQDGALV